MEQNTQQAFETVEKALRPEVTKEQLYMLVNHLHEAIECLIDDGMDEMDDSEESDNSMPEMEGMPDMEDANPAPIGDPNKNDINWPVEKTEGQLIINEEERAIMDQSKSESVKKSLFSNLDPYDLIKRDFSSKERERMASEGHAMPDGSYPIGNKTDLMNAIRSWGRGGADPKVKEHIKRRARALGASDMIPENWK